MMMAFQDTLSSQVFSLYESFSRFYRGLIARTLETGGQFLKGEGNVMHLILDC